VATVRGLCGRTDGQGLGGRHRRQAESTDRLRARIEGSGGGQAKIMGHGLRRLMDGRAGAYKQSRIPAAEWHDGL